jgi:O-antigen ligase
MFLYCSRVSELMPQFRISLAATVILMAGAFATGRVTAIGRTKVGRLLIALTAWTAICVPMSFWPGGSVDVLKTAVQSLLLVAFMIAFVRSFSEVRTLMYTIGAAMGTVGLLSLTIFRAGGADVELLGFGDKGGTLQDPNFMALYLLIGLPFLYMGMVRGKGLLRIVFAVLIPASLAAIARSGSRMGLILLVVGLLVLLKRASQKERVLVVFVLAIGTIVALPLLPKGVLARFTTFFNAKDAQSSDSSGSRTGSSEAAESAQSRWDLLVRSLELTARYPIFGVGPGQFTTADDRLTRQAGGARGMWHYTHNGYTQTSSESGIPGLVLYLMALVASWRGLGQIRRRGPTPLIREMASYAQISLLMVILGGFFLTLGFGGVTFVVMGLSVVFQLAVAPRMPRRQAVKVAAA